MSIKNIVGVVRDIYRTDGVIHLHEPQIGLEEVKHVGIALDSGIISSIGTYVDQFENQISDFCQSTGAVVCVNGTASIHVSLVAAGVQSGDIVLTTPLTFVATTNAILQSGGIPKFIDVSMDDMGLCPEKVNDWLNSEAFSDDHGICRHRKSGAKISAILPVHVFGHPCKVDKLSEIANSWGISLIEDAAESLGSFRGGVHTGTFGRFGALSFKV